MRQFLPAALAVCALILVASAAGSTPGADVRLTNDLASGYTSAYTLATGNAYTDATLTECGISRGRQNEPAVAMDPRNTNVILGSSNDYCGVYNSVDADHNPVASGPIWLVSRVMMTKRNNSATELKPSPCGPPESSCSPFPIVSRRAVAASSLSLSTR